MRIAVAFRAFFKALWDAQFAARLAELLTAPQAEIGACVSGESISARSVGVTPPAKPVPPKPVRSDAITLLSTLQREARFIDMIQEPLGNYSDAQVGAAARDVLRDCGKVLDRLFGLAPLTTDEEGSPVQVPVGYDSGRYRLTGNVSGQPPFQGRLVHHGWQATRCEIPQWSGSPQAALVVAPEEVEVQ